MIWHDINKVDLNWSKLSCQFVETEYCSVYQEQAIGEIVSRLQKGYAGKNGTAKMIIWLKHRLVIFVIKFHSNLTYTQEEQQ